MLLQGIALLAGLVNPIDRSRINLQVSRGRRVAMFVAVPHREQQQLDRVTRKSRRRAAP
jgi:hypothetical protein